jgi:hypothetical protein
MTGPQIPERGSSFRPHTSAEQHSQLEDYDNQAVQSQNYGDRRTRQGISSNTWTSSSGDITEDDANDDRSQFAEEYNRLARKV